MSSSQELRRARPPLPAGEEQEVRDFLRHEDSRRYGRRHLSIFMVTRQLGVFLRKETTREFLTLPSPAGRGHRRPDLVSSSSA